MNIKKSKEVLKKISAMVTKNQNYNDKELLKYCYNNYLSILNNHILRYGNLKLQKNIARFSLPEVVTCSCNCHGCYAKKRLFDNVKKSRLKNLFLVENVLQDNFLQKIFKIKLNCELKIHALNCKLQNKLPIMRWHEAGDIYDINYFNLILQIAKENKKINFYTYTKQFNIWLKYEELKKQNKLPKNFNIVSSFLFNHVNYFDLIKNYKTSLEELRKVLELAREEQQKNNIKEPIIFMCSYGMDKLKKSLKAKRKELKKELAKELNKKHVNFEKVTKLSKELAENKIKKLYQLLHEYNDVILYDKDHMPCGTCHACCNYKYVIFIKH